jgi:hypothetical protein
MKRAKSLGMINNLFLLRYVIDFSDCSPAERRGRVKENRRHPEEMVERGSRERYERNDRESKSRRLTQNSKKDTHLQECR